MVTVHELAEKIIEQNNRHSATSAFTVAISGIDASGKGYVGKLLQQELESKGFKVANINIDPWQNPMNIRLRKENAAENFYTHVFRWNDLFEQLICPLKKTKAFTWKRKESELTPMFIFL